MVHYNNVVTRIKRLQSAAQPQTVIFRVQQRSDRSHADYCCASPNFWRLASALGACTTVMGAYRVKFNTVSEGSLICWLLGAACTTPPTPAPAAVPIAAPLPPPATAPIMPPRIAPPPTFSAVFLPRELPCFRYWSV